MKSKLIFPVLILSAIGMLTFATTSASAHFWGDSSFVKTFSQKLGVSEDKVKSAFESMRSEKKAQMQKDYESYLAQLVKDGKISEDQKNKILSKTKELQAQREAKRAELEKWAKDNNIDPQYLRFGHSRGFRHK